MEAESTIAHKSQAPKSVDFGILVISTGVSSGIRQDRSGGIIREKILAGGHRVGAFTIVADDASSIAAAIRDMIEGGMVTAIVSTGGTGLSKTDVTFETVRKMFVKELTGFTPLFMQLSYDDVGPACMLSRATAGIIDSAEHAAVLFALPGSPKACELAMDKLILPEVAHMTKHFREE